MSVPGIVLEDGTGVTGAIIGCIAGCGWCAGEEDAGAALSLRGVTSEVVTSPVTRSIVMIPTAYTPTGDTPDGVLLKDYR